MSDLKAFGESAQTLAKNPLCIIALFIVLVYGMAALVTGFAGELAASERLPLIYFMVVFPVLVLAVFAWLVRGHSTKLYAPADFKDEANYIRTLQATASLAVASVKGEVLSTADANAVIESVRETESRRRVLDVRSWRNHVLWVDDVPANNANEREAFEAMGLRFTQVTNTAEAMEQLRVDRFAAVISDLRRPEGPRAGFDLLKQIRSEGNMTPFFLYTSSVSPGRSGQVSELGGQGVADRLQALFRMVMRAIVDR